MADFYRTDVDIPATLTIDGRKLPGVGVHFRGQSSYFAVREGRKRSLNVSLDFVDPDQRIDGYKTLNLLNSHEDPSFLHTVLYSEIARHYIPAPKANFVRLVINGESWGLYVERSAVRQEVPRRELRNRRGGPLEGPGQPGGRRRTEVPRRGRRGIQAAVRDQVEGRQVRMESPDRALQDAQPDAHRSARGGLEAHPRRGWSALVPGAGGRPGEQRRLLDPSQRLQSLSRSDREVPRHPPRHERDVPVRDDVWAGTGLWSATRIWPWSRRRSQGVAGRGPGPGLGGPGAGPPARDLDPLVGLDDQRKPLRSRLLAVPSLKARYLSHVRTLAERWLDWETLGPMVRSYRTLIEEEVKADTRKLSSFASFEKALADNAAGQGGAGPGPTGTEPPSVRGKSSSVPAEPPRGQEGRPRACLPLDASTRGVRTMFQRTGGGRCPTG